VLIHNLKFGAMERLGLSADALLAANPRLIYCNLGAFGAAGPLRERPGYDPLMQAFGGLMSVLGEDGRPPGARRRLDCRPLDRHVVGHRHPRGAAAADP